MFRSPFELLLLPVLPSPGRQHLRPAFARCYGLCCLLLVWSTWGCTMLVDFPADCVDSQCPAGFTCEPDGVQCRRTCQQDDHCRADFRCIEGSCTQAGSTDGGADDLGPFDLGQADAGPISGDDDGDRVLDAEDNCLGAFNPDQADQDSDRIGDGCDNCPTVADERGWDQDGDGLGDVCDNCPDKSNRSQADRDGDLIGDSCDNCLNADNPEQEDQDSDGLGDLCDPCPRFSDRELRAQDCLSLVEEEPNGAPGRAMRIQPLPALIQARLEVDHRDPYTEQADEDDYLFSVSSGSVLQVDFLPLSPTLRGRLLIEDATTGQQLLDLLSSSLGQPIHRQLLLDEDRLILVHVQRDREVPVEAGAQPYELLFQLRTLPPATVSQLPYTIEVGTARGELFALRLNAPTTGTLRARFTEDLPAADATRSTAAVLDDVARSLLATGQDEILVPVQAEDKILLFHDPGGLGSAVEAERVTGRWELTMLDQPPEPAGRDGPPVPLPLPGEDIRGFLNAPSLDGQPDQDSWFLAPTPGVPLRIHAEPVNDRLQLALILEPWSGWLEQRVVARGGPGGAATLEALPALAGLYRLTVLDRRNLGFRRSSAVGQDGQEYRLSTREFLPEAPRVAIEDPQQFRFEQPGQLVIFKLPTQANERNRYLVNLTGAGDPMQLQATILGPGQLGVAVQGEGQLPLFPESSQAQVGVVEREQQAGITGRFTVLASMSQFRFGDQQGVATPEQTRSLGLTPHALRDTLDSAEPGEDAHYYLVQVPQGGRLTVFTRAADREDGQVVLPPRLSVSVRLDDQELAWASGLAPRLGPLPLPPGQNQEVLIEVRSPVPDRTRYLLLVDGTRCRPMENMKVPEAGDLILGELLVDPDRDVNGDGFFDVTRASDERFVELVNRTGEPLDVGGLIIEGSGGGRAALPCGLVLRPRQLLLVFGGGRPTGLLGGVAVTQVGPDDRLPGPDDETVSLRLPAALEPFETFTPGPSIVGCSRVRHPELESNFVDHSGVPGADGRPYSPGTLYSGTSFTADRSCIDDRDCSSLESCQLPGAELSGPPAPRCLARTGWGRPGEPCADPEDCSGDRCGNAGAGEQVCLAPCQLGDPQVCATGARCYDTGMLWRTDGQWYHLPACAPDRGSERTCIADPDCAADEACIPLPNVPHNAWLPACRVAVGADQAGSLCVDGTTCRSGICGVPLADGTTSQICLGPCQDESACHPGTTCQSCWPVVDPELGTTAELLCCSP